ncbi:mannosyl transferase [Sulfurifustis variabilis]|uniref:Mannosyl transferase n=1 Tax=Sulfurifustis variabilis TaxID=1675686 RepID=A0A1B4V420_9GAMM|nr:glycosyltransferase family 1 protein [Sulfurifustis variabilis]BAU48125.1 mannosyl transferase [Sulfurifustis variabilis]
MDESIAINTRVIRSGGSSGVLRYTRELSRALAGQATAVAPTGAFSGTAGHLWEQLSLPRRVGRALLFSPSNTGPLAVSRQVVTIHDWAVMDHPEWFSPRFSALYRFLLPRLVARVRRVITVSRFSRERILEATRVDPERVVVVPNAVGPEFRPQSRERTASMRRSLRLKSDRYVLSLGSIEPRKNIPRVLSAWRMAQRQLPSDVWLVIAGAPGSASVFRAVPLNALPERVQLIGRVPEAELPALYTGAIALVYPSLYEGFGLPLLEAMASGTPVIGSSRGAMPEVVEAAGLLVDPRVPEAIAEAVVRVVVRTDLWKTLRHRGLERARRFSWKETARQTLAVLREAGSDA